jgi:hypothetical protein
VKSHGLFSKKFNDKTNATPQFNEHSTMMTPHPHGDSIHLFASSLCTITEQLNERLSMFFFVYHCLYGQRFAFPCAPFT